MSGLASTLDAIVGFVRRFVITSDPERVAIALWVVHTHAFDAAEATPYLAITSAEKASGKTRLLEVLELLVDRPWLTARVTAAVLPRRIDRETSTLLLDESDAAFNGDKEYAETLRGVLNSGYRRGGSVSVCVGQGANISYATLSTFAPKAIAGLGTLPDTVASRSIPIRLRRQAPGEKAERLRRRDAELEAEPIRISAHSIAEHEMGTLAEARPEIPDGLSDRAADVWEPLLAIADLAGGEWPELAREAAVALCSAQGIDEDSIGVRLLADVREIFDRRDVDRISTHELIDALCEDEEAHWADWRGGPIKPRTLGNILRRFDVRSRNVRFDDETQAKGYLRQSLEDVWERYLPATPDAYPSHPSQASSHAGLSLLDDPSQASSGTDSGEAANPHGQRDGADRNGGRPLIGDEMYPVYLAEKGSAGRITEPEFRGLLTKHELVERSLAAAGKSAYRT